MKEKIKKYIDFLSRMTKEESDFIKEILKWDPEEKAAFLLAKTIFEEREDRDD